MTIAGRGTRDVDGTGGRARHDGFPPSGDHPCQPARNRLRVRLLSARSGRYMREVEMSKMGWLSVGRLSGRYGQEWTFERVDIGQRSIIYTLYNYGGEDGHRARIYRNQP